MTIATSTRPISAFVPITKFGAVSSTVGTFGSRACDLLDSHAQDYSATVEGNAIVVHEDVELGADALATMTFLAFLRAALTENVEVRWNARISGNGSGMLDTTPLHHLWPPTTIAVGGLPPEPAGAWRAAFKYGLCYYRRGPGFILIKDTRIADCRVHLTVDHPDLMATFLAGCTLLRDSALTSTQREAVDVLAGENLVYRVADLLLTLPIRMRRWPVPFSAV
jgi:hypothetical protein